MKERKEEEMEGWEKEGREGEMEERKKSSWLFLNTLLSHTTVPWLTVLSPSRASSSSSGTCMATTSIFTWKTNSLQGNKGQNGTEHASHGSCL